MLNPPAGARRALAALLLALCAGCTQNVSIVAEHPEYGSRFRVVTPDKMDRRYWQKVFASGALVNLDKGSSPTLVVVDDVNAPTYEHVMERFPKRWYEALLTPVFGIGHMLWKPYANPYYVPFAGIADQRLRDAAKRIGDEVLALLTPEMQTVGLFGFETDIVERGRRQPYLSEGNRRLTEYVYNHLRTQTKQALQVRLFKATGMDAYLKHTYGSLGEGVEARHELVARFAREERLDVAIYGKNYLYPQAYSETEAINRCRFSIDFLVPKAEKAYTHDIIELILAIAPDETRLMGLFLPPRPLPPVPPVAALEVVIERTVDHLVRDLLEKLGGDSAVLAQYPRPIHTYVSDFGYVVATALDERTVLPNRYGAYMASKVEQGLLAKSEGLFALVDRKKVIDAVKRIPNRGKTVLLGERDVWIDPMTAPQLGKLVGAKLVFFGRMEQIGGDLDVTVFLKTLETGIKLAVVEHKIPLTELRLRRFQLGNLAPAGR